MIDFQLIPDDIIEKIINYYNIYYIDIDIININKYYEYNNCENYIFDNYLINICNKYLENNYTDGSDINNYENTEFLKIIDDIYGNNKKYSNQLFNKYIENKMFFIKTLDIDIIYSFKNGIIYYNKLIKNITIQLYQQIYKNIIKYNNNIIICNIDFDKYEINYLIIKILDYLYINNNIRGKHDYHLILDQIIIINKIKKIIIENIKNIICNIIYYYCLDIFIEKKGYMLKK